MNNFQDNNRLFKKLSRLVVNDYFVENGIQGDVRYGQLVMENFSYHFWIDTGDCTMKRGIYVKIPKASFKKKNIMPATDDDRRLAEEEYRSLVYLSQFWNSGDINVRFIRPLGFLREFNAIITERVYAGELFKTFRRFDMIRKLGRVNHHDPMHDILFRIGSALSRFHQTSISEIELPLDKVIRKIEHICTLIRSFGMDHDLYNRIITTISTLKNEANTGHITKNIKGLDIRNILVDKSHRIFMLDPGRIKEDYKEADLARFLVTCKILYWGSMRFFPGLTPDSSYEESFLQGYYNNKRRADNILIPMIIKELLKHWYMAHIALEFKRWPAPLKRFLKLTYINSFYKRQLNNELAHIRG